jgi:hypothetical protein
MAFFSIVGNEAQYVKYEDGGIMADNVQDAIDNLVGGYAVFYDDAVLIDTDTTSTVFTMVADYGSVVAGNCLVGAGVPGNGLGNNGDWYFSNDNTNIYEKVAGSWQLRTSASYQYEAEFDLAAAQTAVSSNPGSIDRFVVFTTEITANPQTPTLVSGDFVSVHLVTEYPALVNNGDIIVWNSGWEASANTASIVEYDNSTSGLDAADVQAAIDEIVATPAVLTVETPAWETQYWTNLAHDEGAPSSSFAGNGTGSFYVDTDNEDLYGPVFFDGGIPGWNWGSPLANFVYSTVAAPAEEDSGDWWVWFDEGAEFEYQLYRHKTGIEEDDLIEWDAANEEWLSRTPKVDGRNVWVDLTPTLGPNKGVTNTTVVLADLASFSARTYAGGWTEQIAETTTAATYEVNVPYCNTTVLTLDRNVAISFTSDIAAGLPDNITGRVAEVNLLIAQDETGGWDITWAANVQTPHPHTLNVSQEADAVDWFKAISWDNGTTWWVTRIGTRMGS